MKKTLWLLTFPAFISLSACGYKVTRSAGGKTSINQSYFKFNKPMSSSDFSVVDTTTVYKKVKERDYDYNDYIKFYGNGTFLNICKQNSFTSNDLKVENNSVWWGRFIVEGTNIRIEQFYPNQAPNKRYERKVLKGQFKNDTLVINWDKGNLKHIYTKQSLMTSR